MKKYRNITYNPIICKLGSRSPGPLTVVAGGLVGVALERRRAPARESHVYASVSVYVCVCVCVYVYVYMYMCMYMYMYMYNMYVYNLPPNKTPPLPPS